MYPYTCSISKVIYEMKLKSFLFFLCACLPFLSCKQEQPAVDEAEPSLEVSVTDLELSAVAAEAAFEVTSNQDWSADADVDWITLNPPTGKAQSDGAAVSVTAEDNEQEQVRTAVITVKAGSLTKTVSVSQKAKEKEPDVPVDPSALEGSGTETSPYLLKTLEHVLKIRELAKPGSETWFKLMADIDMASVHDWIPVNSDEDFTRVIHFDGNGKTISGFECSGSYPSFFGVLCGTCRDLKIVDAVITSNSYSAGIIGAWVGTQDKTAECINVHVSGKVNVTGSDKTGGFAGVVSSATFADCSADVNVNAPASKYAAGFAGVASKGDVTFERCSSAGEVIAHSYMGGFIGGQEETAVVTLADCWSSARVKGEHHYTAGFAGYMMNSASNPVKVVGCHASGDVTSNGSSCSPFMAFVGNGAEIDKCHATGSVTAVNNIGGLVAWAAAGTGLVHVKDSWYEGKVSGKIAVGGLVAYSDGALKVERCHVSGSVVSSETNCAGILAQKVTGEAVITDSWFKGTVEGVGRVGGIVSYLGTGTASVSRCYSEGRLVTTANALGGIVAHSNLKVTIKDCWSSADLMGYYCQAVGGILGIAAKEVSIENCYAAGEIHAMRGAGGIVGMFNGMTDGKVSKAIVWSPLIRAPRQSVANYSSGAVIGCAKGICTLTDNYHRCDLKLLDPFITELIPHENVTKSLPPLPAGVTDVNQCAYNGKPAAGGLTLAELAKSLGWDATVWDFSAEGNELNIKELGDNKIEF